MLLEWGSSPGRNRKAKDQLPFAQFPSSSHRVDEIPGKTQKKIAYTIARTA